MRDQTEGRCQKEVRQPGTWPRYAACSRLAVRDGFCKQHHPDAVKAREKARSAAADAVFRNRQENSALSQLHRVATENKALREELAKLRAALEMPPFSVVYKPCGQHLGLPWTMRANYHPPLREVCPICEQMDSNSESGQ